MRNFLRLCTYTLAFQCSSSSQVLDFLKDVGGIPDDSSEEACRENSHKLSNVLQYNASKNVLWFPPDVSFHFQHGVLAAEVNDTIIQIDGTLRFERFDLDIDRNYHPFPACIAIVNSRNVTVTSLHGGLIDGRGSQWWGIPVIGYLETVENRPRLLRFNLTQDLLIENIILQDSPYHTLYLDTVNHVEIRNISIVARRTTQDGHSWIDLSAFNTDGIDVSGTNVWIHDVDIWVQDDCIAVKDVGHHANVKVPFISANMTFERINATGLGFVIGSIQGTHVSNITFRNSYLHKPVKGIYMKFARRFAYFREKNMYALVENVTYENITMVEPQQWPIWIGPAQQADSRNICHPNPCSLCWPMTPGSKCNIVPRSKFRNITLKNVIIHSPKMATGILLGNSDNTIDNVLFDDVRVTNGIPPLIARRPLNETFPGTRQPVHDAHVPPYATRLQREITGFGGFIYKLVVRIGRLVQSWVERIHLEQILQLLQTQDGAQKWYLSYLLQALLDTVWVWIVLAMGFSIAGVFSFRAWIRYRQRLRIRLLAALPGHRQRSRERASNGEEADENSDDIGEDDDNDQEHIDQTIIEPNEALLSIHPRVDTRWPSVLCHLGFFFLICLCWGGALYTGTFPFRKPKWERTYQYYACQSVFNGIARGNTWPVPRCFKHERPPWWSGGGDDDGKEEHHRQERHRHGSDKWSPHKVDLHIEMFAITAMVSLTVLVAGMGKYWREQWRNSRVVSSAIPSFVTVQSRPNRGVALMESDESMRQADDEGERFYMDGNNEEIDADPLSGLSN